MTLSRAPIAVAAVWLLALASSLPAAAQQDGAVTVDIASVDQTRPLSLSAVVNVLDASGRPVADLDAAAFSATVDGQPAPIEGLQSVVDSQVSLAVVLVVDASGSMVGEPLSAAQSAAADFVNGLSSQDSVAVLAFSDEVTIAQEPTRDKGTAVSALQGLSAIGNTALFEATSRAAAKAAESSSPRRVIILLSDGLDYGGKSDVTRDDSITQARAAGIPLYTIGLGAEVDRAYLTELAQATGARFLEAPTPATLSQLYADIAAVLRGQYVVNIAMPTVDANASHQLELSVKVDGATAVATETLAPSAGLPSTQITVHGLDSGEKVTSGLTVSAEISGAQPEEVRFLIGEEVLATFTSPPYEMSLDPKAIGDGIYVFRVEARDATGVVAAQEIGFGVEVPVPARASPGKVLLLGGLVAAMVLIIASYALRRRRPHVKRKHVEGRLKPWSENGAVVGSISLIADDTPVAEEPSEPVVESVGKLIVENGTDAGREFNVGTNPLSVGSAPWCDIRIIDKEDRIGPEEARVWVSQDKLLYHKLTRLSLLANDASGSPGGWLILEDGEEVSVGPVRLRFVSLTPVRKEEAAVSEAVQEAVERLGNRAPGGVVTIPSRLWPVDEPEAAPPDEHLPEMPLPLPEPTQDVETPTIALEVPASEALLQPLVAASSDEAETKPSEEEKPHGADSPFLRPVDEFPPEYDNGEEEDDSTAYSG